MQDRLHCHITVAAVIPDRGRYLFVEEWVQGRRMLNQPAGHLEAGEDLITAVIREVREETCLDFVPEAWLGCDLLTLPNAAVALRIAFSGPAQPAAIACTRDPVILANHWLTPAEAAAQWPLRSPLVQRSLQRYAAGVRLPLETLGSLVSGA